MPHKLDHSSHHAPHTSIWKDIYYFKITCSNDCLGKNLTVNNIIQKLNIGLILKILKLSLYAR